MMETIRTAANNIIVKIIFGIIILAFIFTGVGGFFGSSSNDSQLYIAKIDGEGLDRTAFEREAQYATQNSGTLGGNDDSFIRSIRRSVLAGQIDNYLSYKLADDLNAQISDEQVKNAIRQQPVFFEKGAFSNRLYLELLAANGYTPDVYAEAIRASMKQEQVMKALIQSDFVLPVDSDISILLDQTRTVYLADYSINNIDNDQFTITDEEIADYYENNKNEFYHEPRVKMKFVTNFLPTIQSDVNITPEQVKAYYDANKPWSIAPGEHQYSILAFDDLASANKEYKAIVKLKGKNRAKVKMENIGWLPINDSLPDLLKKAALKKVNDISKPIEQNGEFYIVRLDKIQKSKKYPFDYAKDIILEKLYNEQVEKTYAEQQEKLEKAMQQPAIEGISEKSGLELYTSNWNYEEEALGITRFPEVAEVAFSDLMIQDGKATGNISDSIYVAQYDSTYVIQVTDYQEAGISPFDDVKEEIESKLLKEKKKALFSQKVSEILTQLNETDNAEDIVFARRVTLDRNSVDSSISKEAIDDIFALVPPLGKNIHGATIVNDERAIFYVLIDVKNGEVKDLSETLKPKQIEMTQQNLRSDLREKADIEIMPNSNL